MNKIVRVVVCVVFAVLGTCARTAFATTGGMLFAESVCVKDSNGAVITDIRDAQKGEICHIGCEISNTSSSDADVTVYAASYDGRRFKNVQKESFDVAAGAAIDVDMEFEWYTDAQSGNERFCVFVFDSNLSPLCDELTICYTENLCIYTTTDKIYEEDFEDGIPEDWTDSGYNFSNCEIYTDSVGNKLLLMNANNSVIQSPRILAGSTNVAVTADFYQMSSTGSGISALGLGRYASNDSASQRFMYYDVVTPSARLRDVFGYATSESSILADKYTYASFSEAMGLLDTDTRNTNPFSMTAAYYNGTIFCNAEDSGKNTLWNYSTDVSADRFLFDDMIHSTGGFVLFSHSAETYIDNLVAYTVTEADELIVDIPHAADINKWYDIKVKAIDETGNGYFIPAENITFKYDAESVEIENEKIKLLREGKHQVLAVVQDPVTLAKGWAKTNVSAVLGIDSLAIENLSDAYKSGEEITFDVKAYKNDENVAISAYEVYCDKTQTDGTTITGLTAGEHTIKVTYNGVSAEKTVYVSKYSDATLSVTNVTTGKQYGFTLSGITETATETITDYTAEYDENSLIIENGTVTALKPGTHKITFNFDNVSVTAEISAAPAAGTAVTDSFETTDTKTQYFNYDTADVVSYGTSNHVLSLENEVTDLTNPGGLSAYTISGKFRIDPDSVDKDAYSAGFEIVTRRASNEMFGARNKGVHFIYNPDGNGSADMRIGTSLYGEKLEENGGWHDFSATMYSRVCVFNIDGHEMVTAVSTTLTAGFYMIANNCNVMLDDVSVTLTPSSSEAIGAVVFSDTLNPYEVYPITDIAALRRGDSDVYMNPGNITWTAPEGSGISIKDGYISFDDGIADGEYTITATYSGTAYPFTVNVKTPSDSRLEYVQDTVEARQKNLALRLSERNDEYGTDFAKGELSYLPAMYAKMLLYPKLADYSDALIWHVNTAQYQDTIVGRGNDGGDFVMLQLIMAYKELYGEIIATDEAWDFVKEYLTSVHYAEEGDSHSENHMLVHYATALLTAENYPDSVVSGDSASQTHEKYKGYLTNWYNKRLERGFGEYNSAHYYFIDTYALEALYTYTTDAEIKQICYDMLNYIYADGLDNNIGDNFGGAALRTYAYKELTTRFAGFKRMFNLGDYAIDEKYDWANLQMSQTFASDYRPTEILYKIALDNDRRYENTETSETYHLPNDEYWDSFVTRYTYVTPDYVIGSKVGYITPTQAGTISDLDGHQEMPWSVQFGSKPSRLILGGLQSRNSTTNRLYWMSSKGQNTYRLMQNKNMLVGIYELTDESTFVHYRIPKNEFETMEEESGWIFIDDGDAYLAFKPVADTDGDVYIWSTDTTISGEIKLSESEIKVTENYSGFVLQVVDKTEYTGTYEKFKSDIINNSVVSFEFSDTNCNLTYTGINGDSAGVDYYNSKSYRNGTEYIPDTTKLHSSPYVNAVIDEGVVTITYGDESYIIRCIEK